MFFWEVTFMLKYVWTKFEILTPYIFWDTVHFVEILKIHPKIASALLWLLYGLYMGKTNFEKTFLKEFFDAFMMIWVWKSGYNSWNQKFWKCTLFVWSTVCVVRKNSSTLGSFLGSHQIMLVLSSTTWLKFGLGR